MTRASPDTARKRIVEVIGNSVYHALGLKETLTDELSALESQDMDALRSAVDDKSKCVEALQLLEDERREFCASLGFEPGLEQMAKLMAWCDDDLVIANCWQHLLDIAVECNAMNLTNGSIIRSRQQQIQAGLAVVRGDTAGPATYGQRGQRSGGRSQRALAEA